MNKRILIIPVIVIIIAIIAFFFLQSGSSGDHELIFHFEDGTTSSLPNLGIEYDGKHIISVTYRVLGDIDTSEYTPYFETPFGNYQLEARDNGTWEIPIYELINYNVDDGVYTLKLFPNGTLYKDGEMIQLPEDITFNIEVYDNRAIGIIIG